MSKSLWLHSAVAIPLAIMILTASRAIGSMGSGAGSIEALVHSTILVFAAYPFQTLVASTAMSRFGDRVPLWACAVGGCVVAAAPASLVAPSASWIVGVMPTGDLPVETREDFFANVSQRLHFVFLGFATLGTAFWMLFNFRWWVDHLQTVPETPHHERAPEHPATSADEELVRRLPAPKRGRLLAISAEQHYVRVRTEAGEDLVLMPFSEAIALPSTGFGMRVHRSHWVSRSAVKAIKSTSSGYLVVLENDIELPVSRSYSGTVRENWADLIDA